MALMRNGVHALPVAGISGTRKSGVLSVLVGVCDGKNNLSCADTDIGEVIEYIGTARNDHPDLGPTNIKDAHMSVPDA